MDIINNVINFFNNLFNDLNEPFQNTLVSGTSFFVENDIKYYQQLLNEKKIPIYIYRNKIFRIPVYNIEVKNLGKFNFEQKYTLGDMIKFQNDYYIALPIPNPTPVGNDKYTDFIKKILPETKFGDFTPWKKVIYLDKPKTYNKTQLFPRKDVPEEVDEETILDDSNPNNIIKINVKASFDPFEYYQVGDLVKHGKLYFVNLLLIKDRQQAPSKKSFTWVPVKFEGIMSDAYISSNTVPSKIFQGEEILPKSIGTKIRQEYKTKMKGDYSAKKKYKLGDIVKHKKKYYVSLVRGSGYLLDKPGTNKKQWKLVKLLKGKPKKNKKKVEEDEEDDEEEDNEEEEEEDDEE